MTWAFDKHDTFWYHTPMKKYRQMVQLTQPQWAFMQKEAAKLGISLSELARRIIDQYRQATQNGR